MPEHIVTTGDEIVIEAGDVALVIAKLYLVPKAAPHTLPCDGKRAVYVMQRNDSGEWRCIIDNFFGTDLLDFA
jgi:ketosteroid isomerase-like protein